MAAAASYPAGVLVEECAGLVGALYSAGVLVGTSVLDVRFGCEVCLILDPGYQHPFYQLDRSSDRCCLDGGFGLTGL